jgi:hypothetical protein
MFGFHPFATQAFSSAVPFLDVQTTTNLVSAAKKLGVQSLTLAKLKKLLQSKFQKEPDTIQDQSKPVYDRLV